MRKTPKLLASYFTICGDIKPLTGNILSPFNLRSRALAVAEAGYVGMGIATEDLRHNVELHGYNGISSILNDAGIQYFEIEVLLDWFTDGKRRAASDKDRTFLLEAAEKLDAYQIKAVGDIVGTQWPIDVMIESFADLCSDAREVGTQVTIEIFPASNIANLSTALAIVEGAAAKNGGLLLDTWHFFRGNIPYEDIETIPLQYIKHIELDDADEELVGSIMEDTLLRRRLPGQGDADVQRFIRHVQATGYDGIYGVEILSDEHRALSVEQAANDSFRASMNQFETIANDED
jgi:sugar phosphate isomerase/epimerase